MTHELYPQVSRDLTHKRRELGPRPCSIVSRFR